MELAYSYKMGLTRLESRKKQIEAEFLYLQGMANDAIAREIHVNDKTIDRWQNALNWKERKRLIDEQIALKLAETATEVKERHLKIIKATQMKYVQNLQNPDYELNASAVPKFMALEKDWVSPSPETRSINFTQNNINQSIHINQWIELIKKAKQKPWTKSENQLIS